MNQFTSAVIASLLCVSTAFAADELLADFEGPDYGTWTTTGTAFGTAPARGTLPNQQNVGGFRGNGLVNSYVGGDATTGTLTSPEFAVSQRYLNFLIGGGAHAGQTCVNLLVGGKVVRTATGADDEFLNTATWDLGEFAGKMARIQIMDTATGGWGHINADHFVLSDRAATPPVQPLVIDVSRLYDETYRPQFHFTARSNWLNDPNGLVYYAGEYHLFFQHNPRGINWGNMTWGHAVSTNLIHWRQLEHALLPDALGTMFSGSAVVDEANSGGFQRGNEKTLVAIFTAAGGTSPESKGQPFTQGLAYSNDRGRSWTKFPGNPVLKNVNADNRDPKVIWHAPTRQWVMVLYVPMPDPTKKDATGKVPTVHTLQFFGSTNLTAWNYLSRLDGFFECPDLIELPVDGDPQNTRWVIFGASGEYQIGKFDGRQFTPETLKLRGDFGKNFYAAQTYSGVPAGRHVLIGWMNGGKYPGMPFNQQMSFPVELSLRTTPKGLRLAKWPVREITALNRRITETTDAVTLPGDLGELLDVEAVIEPGTAARCGLEVRGAAVVWSAADRKLTALGATAPVPLQDGRLRLRLLVDRSSLEVFAEDGLVVMSSCFLPRPDNRAVKFISEGGVARLVSLRVTELSSAWSPMVGAEAR